MSNKRLLNLVHPEKSPHPKMQVSVGIELVSDVLIANFDVRGQVPHVNASLSKDSSQWGLWDYDVVELFVTANPNSSTYFEFQVSPLGQFFELEIFEPRKKFNREFQSGFEREAVQLSKDHWTAKMRIPLKALGWDGKQSSIRGNAFAILGSNTGQSAAKSYWSLTLPPQSKPDFHLPEHFQALLSLA